MAQCPKCQSTNVVVTEEVYTRKGKSYYSFWQLVIVVGMILFGFVSDNLALGFILAFVGAILVSVFSLFNAGKKAVSRTKLSCLNCKEKIYL